MQNEKICEKYFEMFSSEICLGIEKMDMELYNTMVIQIQLLENTEIKLNNIGLGPRVP